VYLRLLRYYDGHMDDAKRYQRDFDLLMQEAEAEATRRADADRSAIWNAIEKSFNAVATSAKLSEERREALKKQILDRAVEHVRGRGVRRLKK